METTVPRIEPRLSQRPISATFPELSDDECKLLKDDIEAHGQKYPILVSDDQVLDGWHRYKACRELGIEPKLEDFTRPDPVSVVISLNLEKIERRLASRRAKAGS
jgi:ParB-like chromosome segregation protein Spo0J